MFWLHSSTYFHRSAKLLEEPFCVGTRTEKKADCASTQTNALVTLVFEVLAVAVVHQQGVWVVLADPLHLLHVERALGLHPLPFTATRHWDGQA